MGNRGHSHHFFSNTGLVFESLHNEVNRPILFSRPCHSTVMGFQIRTQPSTLVPRRSIRPATAGSVAKKLRTFVSSWLNYPSPKIIGLQRPPALRARLFPVFSAYLTTKNTK